MIPPPLDINYTWNPKINIHFLVWSPLNSRTSRSFETFCNLSWTSLSSISLSLTFVNSLFNNNSWNYKSPSTSFRLAANLVTKALAWSTSVGFEEPWHLFSHITRSSFSSFAFFKRHSLFLSIAYKDLFLSTKPPSNVCTRVYILDFIFSKYSFLGGKLAVSFLELSRSFLTNTNYFGEKILTCLE